LELRRNQPAVVGRDKEGKTKKTGEKNNGVGGKERMVSGEFRERGETEKMRGGPAKDHFYKTSRGRGGKAKDTLLRGGISG